MHIRPQVVDPELFRPRLLAGGLAVEEQDVRLDALGIEYPRRQAQERMHVALLEQLPPDRLTGPAFKQHVIRHDDRAAAVDLQDRLDMLQKIELFVAGRRPEIVPL